MGSLAGIAMLRVAVFAALMASAVWFDASQRRLPNLLVLLTFVAGALTAMIQFGPVAFGSNALHSIAALVVMVGLYAIGWIGAGDAKFYAAIAAWFPLAEALDVLVTISTVAIVLVLGWLLVLRLVRGPRTARERTAKFPLGVPIAVGAFAQFLRYAMMPVV